MKRESNKNAVHILDQCFNTVIKFVFPLNCILFELPDLWSHFLPFSWCQLLHCRQKIPPNCICICKRFIKGPERLVTSRDGGCYKYDLGLSRGRTAWPYLLPMLFWGLYDVLLPSGWATLARLSFNTPSMTGWNKTKFTGSKLTCILKTSILTTSSYTRTYAYFNNRVKHFVV